MKEKKGKKIEMNPKNGEKTEQAPPFAPFIGLKDVQARRMNQNDFADYIDRPVVKEPDDKEGYLVVYPDSYESWSPKEVFEKAYRKIGQLTFGIALESLKRGKVIRRLYWPQNKFLQLKPRYPVDEYMMPNFEDEKKKKKGSFDGELSAYIVCAEVYSDPLIKGKFSVRFTPWIGEFEDYLKDDWVVMDPPSEEKKD